ncbi:hypothetical protein MNBD_ALPHA04-1334, partial [hydrothermal vent metagenome]
MTPRRQGAASVVIFREKKAGLYAIAFGSRLCGNDAFTITEDQRYLGSGPDPYVFQICYKVPSPDLCKDLGWGG